MNSSLKLVSEEVLRKLQLASESLESPQDREIICEEVFVDITGYVDAEAQARLKLSQRACFYQLLAAYYYSHTRAANQLLQLCQGLWGQPFIAPIYSLLLHRWLLLYPDAGGREMRQKHVNVLMFGGKQLLLGDVHSCERRFEPLFRFLVTGICLNPDSRHLDQLPAQARTTLLGAVAAYAPYYCSEQELRDLVDSFPSMYPPGVDEGPWVRGETVDFVMAQVTETLQKIRSEAGVIQYLTSLCGLGGSDALKQHMGVIGGMRLQAELYGLATPGGPHYPPRSVQLAALAVLDKLYPMGRTPRKVVRLLFRVLHPTDWLGEFWLAPVRWWTHWYARLVGRTAMTGLRLVNYVTAELGLTRPPPQP